MQNGSGTGLLLGQGCVVDQGVFVGGLDLVIINKGPFGFIIEKYKDHFCNCPKFEGLPCDLPKVFQGTNYAKMSNQKTIFDIFQKFTPRDYFCQM